MDRKFYIQLIILTFLVFGITVARAKPTDRKFELRFEAGISTLDPTVGDNAATLTRIDAQLKKIAGDSTLRLSAVTFTGTASPDGSRAFNRQLSLDRAAAIEQYIRARIDIPADCRITRDAPGIAWEQLTEMVEASEAMPYRDEVLNILRTKPESTYDDKGRLIASRKKDLMDLRGGRPWHYMDEHFFADLRSAASLILTVENLADEPEAEVTPVFEPDVTEVEETNDTITSTDELEDLKVVCLTPYPPRAFMAVKTNMLLDVLALPNVGVEFCLGNKFSVGANWMYGWWDCNKRHRYWRAYGGEINARYWFNDSPFTRLQGHHIGIYGNAFIYDFEFGGKGQMGGQPGEPLWHNPSYSAGVEYGYSMRLSRRFNIDFTIGVGYLGGKYFEYHPVDNHYVWDKTKRRNWFGPTKAEVTLVWILGKGGFK